MTAERRQVGDGEETGGNGEEAGGVTVRRQGGDGEGADG